MQADIRTYFKEWIFALVQDRNETAVTTALGISRSTLARALAGLTIYPGSRLMIETGMAAIDASEGR